MIDITFITDIIVTILLVPLQLVLVPIDALLNQIPGISVIPASINAIGQFIGSIPSTLVNLFGIHPLVWNALFITFVLYMTMAPGIQIIKKVWGWIRP